MLIHSCQKYKTKVKHFKLKHLNINTNLLNASTSHLPPVYLPYCTVKIKFAPLRTVDHSCSTH